MRATTSTTILRVDYDAFARELTVTFSSHKTYVYFGVSAEVYRDLTAAPSKDTYFNLNIRDHFRYRERR